MTFVEAARLYLDELERTGGKDLVEKRRRLQLHLVPFFGRLPLSGIDSVSVDRYKKQRLDEPSLRGGVRRGANAVDRPVADRSKRTSPATVNRELAVLSHLINCAVEWGWITSAPVRIRRYQERQTRFEYLTETQIAQLLAAAAADRDPHIYAFVYIAVHTAMRAGEVLSLRHEFIDLDRFLIHLPRSKTGARDVPVSPQLKEFLLRIRSRPADSAWLFPSATSKSGHATDITRPWNRIIAAADLSGRRITRHTLRHTAITHLVQAGVDLPTVQSISGHRTFEMVRRYSHQNSEHIQGALGQVGRAHYRATRGASEGTFQLARLHRNYTARGTCGR